MSGMVLIAWLGMLACEEPVEFSAVTEVLDLTTPDRIVVGSGIGVDQVEIPVRVVNSYDATVPGQLFELEVTGDSLGSYNGQLRPDALGFASLVIESEQPQAITAQVVFSEGKAQVGHEATSWLTGAELHAPPLQRGFGLDIWPDFVARSSGGVVWSSAEEVWFQRTDLATPPQRILVLPDVVDGLNASDLDRDGYQDLVVWTQTRVVLLRGRGVDGFSWSTAFTTPGARLRGVDVADFDGDRLVDLAVGFADVDGIFQGAQVLLQDGFDNWLALPPLRRELEITDVALGDFVGNGLSELVVLTDAGPLRYGYVEDWEEPDRAWNRVDPDLAWLLDPGGKLLPSRDLDNEGTPELIGVGPAASLDSDLHLSFYTIDETATRFDLGFPDFASDVIDITGDGVDDIALLVPDGAAAQLRAITTDADDGNFKNRGLANLPVLGELAVGDLDSDGDRDVVVAGENLWLYQGAFDDGAWGIDDSETTSFGLSLAGPVHLYDWDQDGRTDVLAIREVSDGVVLQHFEVGLDQDSGSTVLQSYDDGQVSLDDHDGTVSAVGLDIAVCDDDEQIYVLVNDGETVAYRIRRTGSGGLDRRDSGVVDGTAIACGTLGGGAVAAVVSASGDVTELNGSLAAVAVYSGGAAASDLAVADLDGSGPAVLICETQGCSLAAGDLDGDGLDDLLEGGDVAQLHTATRSISLGASGLASIADLDGDGDGDLVLTDTDVGSVALIQRAGADRLPVWWLHTRREVLSAVHFGDVDADGNPELWFVSDGGTLVHTAPTGLIDIGTDTQDTGTE